MVSPELQKIIEDEQKHFSLKRILNYLLTLVLLFVTSMLIGSKYDTVKLVPLWVSIVATVLFTIYCVVMTILVGKHLKKIHQIKDRDGY